MINNISSFENVDIYREGRADPIFKNLNINILTGQFYWLIGKSGTGKSSFLKAIYGEIPIQCGKILFEDLDINNLPHDEKHILRRKTGIIFQENRLINHYSPLEYLKFILKSLEFDSDKIETRINEIVEEFQLESILNHSISKISGGEKQKLAIARALLLDPNLILADEACAHLDLEESSKIILNLFNLCKQGKSVIFATHQTKLMEKFPARVLRIENQTVMEL